MTFPEALSSHLETWGPHCGASLEVYRGHLMKLLEAHSAQLNAPTAPGTLKLTRSLCILDTETTGVDPVTSRIVELGICILKPDNTRVRWQQRFNPQMPIPPEATAVHHITDEDVRYSPSFAGFAHKIHAGLQGKDIAGYNLRGLDLPILDQEFRRSGLKLDLAGVQVIDAAGIFFKKEPRTLSAAVQRYCGRSHEDAHGALADSEATLDVLLGQLGAYEDLAGMGLSELAAYSRRDDKDYVDHAQKVYRDADGAMRFGFGKCKDQRVCDDMGFARWMLDKDFTEDTKDWVREGMKQSL